jgi:hypothetical protein
MADGNGTRIKVEVELDIEVVDAAALQRAALAKIDAMKLVVDDGEDAEAIKDDERAEVRHGPGAALLSLLDPCDLIPDGAGIDCHSSMHGIGADAGDSSAREDRPDFDALFEVCHCGRDESCQRCAGFQLTPRTAAILWRTAQVLGDQAYDDVKNNGDELVADSGEWAVFDEYPRTTFAQNAVWRRQAARSFDDLAGDLELGRWPQPTCPGEEMALHLILRLADAAVQDDWWDDLDELSAVAAHPDDLDWDMAGDCFFQDSDILALFDKRLDGIDDPDTEPNRLVGMGDYRPGAWFRAFNNMPARDGRRPFRR